MSNKSKLQKALHDYISLIDEVGVQHRLIDSDTRVKDEVKEAEKRQATWDRVDRLKEIRGRALDAVEGMKADLQVRYRREAAERLQDGSYQASLSATVNALKAGVIQNPYDLEAVSLVFGKDPSAMGILRPIAAERGLILKGAVDNRAKNLETLEALRVSVDTYIDTPYLTNSDEWRGWGVSGTRAAIDFLDGTDDYGARW